MVQIKGIILYYIFVSYVTELQGVQNVFNVYVDIITKAISVTEDDYLSFCLDPYLKVEVTPPWGTLNFSHPRLHTLARGLAPALLRFGGTDADFAFFYNVTDKEKQYEIKKRLAVSYPIEGRRKVLPIFPGDINNLWRLAKSAGGKVLYDLTIQPRFGSQWDSRNAVQLFKYIIEKGYAKDFDFEMGNEPPYNEVPGRFNATGSRIGKDFVILRNLLNSFPELRTSRLVGPDVETPREGNYTGEQANIVKDFVEVSKDILSAVTVHHYYFAGPGKSLEDFYSLKYLHYLESTLPLLRNTIEKAAGKDIAIWIGETSDASSEGTPNITNTYASGFFWLDKLGLAAKNGIKLVARQDLYGANYPLINPQLYPNPDYWLSYIYKKLIGREVLRAYVLSQKNSEYIRVYAHCASHRSGYQPGTVVLYAINLNPNDSVILKFNSFVSGPMHVYLLQPAGSNLQSANVMLNSQELNMVDDNTFPTLKPRITTTSSGFMLPSLTFGFIVFPNLQAEICQVNN